jgi:Flp pilus assembly protein TadD
MRPLAVMTLALFAACAGPKAPALDVQAETMRRQDKLAESFALYGRALCATPDDLTLALKLVDVWHELGATGEVRASLGSCRLPAGVQAYVDGLAAGAQGHVDDADGLLGTAETLVGEGYGAEVAYRRGLVLLAGREAGRAQVALERAAGLAPGRVDVRLALAQALMDRGAISDCVAVLRGIMSVTPNREEIHRARRMLQTAVTRNEPPLAEDVERTVRELLAELEHGQPSAEATARLQALALEVNHPRVLTVAALAALKRGFQSEAERLLEAAAILNPLDPAPWRALGGTYYSTDRAGEALKPLREAFERDPYDVEVAEMLAATSAAVGEIATARQTYRALTVLVPERADYHLGLARMERRLGRPEAALAAASRGLSLEATSVPLLLEVASIDAELASKAPTEVEREEARDRAHADVARLRAVAPDHPAAAAILESLKGG